jgi:hypothetical protein
MFSYFGSKSRIDPPYQRRPRNYRTKPLDYNELAAWVKSRQPEAPGAIAERR